MIVVAGHEAPDVVAALGDRIFEVVEVDPDAEMLDSIRAGLEPIRRTGLHDAVLMQLGDHPIVSESTVRAMLDAGDSDAVIPECDGGGGHPVLIPVAMLDDIIAFTGAGLRAYWETTDRVRRVPVEDPWVCADLDTPEAYDEARRRSTH